MFLWPKAISNKLKFVRLLLDFYADRYIYIFSLGMSHHQFRDLVTFLWRTSAIRLIDMEVRRVMRGGKDGFEMEMEEVEG